MKVLTGEVFLVKFHPGLGSELQKYRPAVVVSDKVTDIDGRFVLIAPFTTHTEKFHRGKELLIRDNEALEKEYVLLCWYLWTVDTERLVKKLGELSESDRKSMLSVVKKLF